LIKNIVENNLEFELWKLQEEMLTIEELCPVVPICKEYQLPKNASRSMNLSHASFVRLTTFLLLLILVTLQSVA